MAYSDAITVAKSLAARRAAASKLAVLPLNLRAVPLNLHAVAKTAAVARSLAARSIAS